MFEIPFALLPFEKNQEFTISGVFAIRVYEDKSKEKTALLYCKTHIKGDISKLKMGKKSASPKKVEGLWNSTCFEIFIKSKASSHYIEWNFAPSSEWWTMDFSDYRLRLNNDSNFAPQNVLWERSHKVLTCELTIPIPAEFTNALSLGISSILETGQEKSHWALAHKGEKPDFHDARSFRRISVTEVERS